MYDCGSRSECSNTAIKYKDKLEPVTSASTHDAHATITLPHFSAQLNALLVTHSLLPACAYSQLSSVLSSRHCWGRWSPHTRAGSQARGTAPPRPQRMAEGQTCARTEMADYHTRTQGGRIGAVSPTNALHRHKMQQVRRDVYMDYTTWYLLLSLPPFLTLFPSPPLPPLPSPLLPSPLLPSLPLPSASSLPLPSPSSPSLRLLPSPPLPYFSNGITDCCSRSLTILFSSEGFRLTLTTGL